MSKSIGDANSDDNRTDSNSPLNINPYAVDGIAVIDKVKPIRRKCQKSVMKFTLP